MSAYSFGSPGVQRYVHHVHQRLVEFRPLPPAGPSAGAVGQTARMAVETALASSDDMRNYLVDQFNLVLRRPGMYGDVELAAWMAIDHLLFLE